MKATLKRDIMTAPGHHGVYLDGHVYDVEMRVNQYDRVILRAKCPPNRDSLWGSNSSFQIHSNPFNL